MQIKSYNICMLTYEYLIDWLKKSGKYNIRIKPLYTVILFPNSRYHITIYRDQWDDYPKITGMPYHLFHISSDDVDNRCSSYYWVDDRNRIKKIPSELFKYRQSDYGYSSSTRYPCQFNCIKKILKFFQDILKNI
jgi:hypothetical protein